MNTVGQMLVRSFPEIVNEFAFSEEGVVIEPAGDAILVRKCEVVSYTRINWNQSYQHIPIRTMSGENRFLELPTRRVFNFSNKISCLDKLNNLVGIRIRINQGNGSTTQTSLCKMVAAQPESGRDCLFAKEREGICVRLYF